MGSDGDVPLPAAAAPAPLCTGAGWESATFPGKNSLVLRCCFSFQLDCGFQFKISASLLLTQQKGKPRPCCLCTQPLLVILSHLLELLSFLFPTLAQVESLLGAGSSLGLPVFPWRLVHELPQRQAGAASPWARQGFSIALGVKICIALL